MSRHRITTADHADCGVEITRTGPNGYALTGIETGEALGVALSPASAIANAGKYLMTYRDYPGTQRWATTLEGWVLDAADEPDGEDVIVTTCDWSATYEQGRQMVELPGDFVADMEDALEDEDE